MKKKERIVFTCIAGVAILVLIILIALWIYSMMPEKSYPGPAIEASYIELIINEDTNI